MESSLNIFEQPYKRQYDANMIISNAHSIDALRLALFVLLFGLLAGCSQEEPKNVTLWPMIEDCSLHQQSCTSKMGNSSVTLKISPDPIPVARPLGIELQLENLTAKKVELDISGANMYMGYNRVTLSPTEKEGRYVGTSMLAFCTTQKMKWKITLMIHQQNGNQIQIPYLLETDQ